MVYQKADEMEAVCEKEEKGTTEDEMVGWHHGRDGHEFEQALGVGDGQGSLECCSPWGHKESDMTEWLNNKFVYWGCIVRGPDVVWWGGYFQSLDEELEWCNSVTQVSIKKKRVDYLVPSEIEIANIGLIGRETTRLVREKHKASNLRK